VSSWPKSSTVASAGHPEWRQRTFDRLEQARAWPATSSMGTTTSASPQPDEHVQRSRAREAAEEISADVKDSRDADRKHEVSPDPHRKPAESEVSSQAFRGPTKVLTATERARLEDQTVPYVGEVPPVFAASAGPYPRINPGAVNFVRALLENTFGQQPDTVPLPRVEPDLEPPTIEQGGAIARTAGKRLRDLPEGVAQGARPADPLIGRVIGCRYEIRSLLATGGMGRVYRAQQSSLGRTVALKVFKGGYSQDPNAEKRYFREAAIASKLRHPNTVKIFDYGVAEDNVCYIAMELLSGRTLSEARREDGTFKAERAIHIARQVCRSLAEAHALGVIHRDLKPSNIHLTQHGDEPDFVKVLDFGLVKEIEEEGEPLTQTGLFMGSPQYSSPEQIRGKAIDARSDIYSLGVVIHEMLTGNVPFQQEVSVDILMAHLHEPVPEMGPCNAHDVGPELQAIVKKCMAKDPDQRFASMEELHAALTGVSGPRSARASTPPRATVSIATAASDSSATARTLQRRSALAALRRGLKGTLALLAVLLVAALLFMPTRVHDSKGHAKSEKSVGTAAKALRANALTIP